MALPSRNGRVAQWRAWTACTVQGVRKHSNMNLED